MLKVCISHLVSPIFAETVRSNVFGRGNRRSEIVKDSFGDEGIMGTDDLDSVGPIDCVHKNRRQSMIGLNRELLDDSDLCSHCLAT